jgi:predicted nucleic acid-binding protein
MYHHHAAKIGTMMTGAKVFVDTNILLRAFHETMPEHEKAKALIDKMMDEDVEFWISRQIIREYLVQATHPRTFEIPLTMEQVLGQLETIQSLFRIADETAAVTTQLLSLLKVYPTGGKQIHDANIVATMLVYGIDTLLTINVADLKRFEDKIKLIAISS